jgi:hypothetical protein
VAFFLTKNQITNEEEHGNPIRIISHWQNSTNRRPRARKKEREISIIIA